MKEMKKIGFKSELARFRRKVLRVSLFNRQERDLMTRTDRFGVEVRERIMWDIREGVIGSDTFIPKHVIFVTWKNMSFAGGIDNSLFKVKS